MGSSVGAPEGIMIQTMRGGFILLVRSSREAAPTQPTLSACLTKSPFGNTRPPDAAALQSRHHIHSHHAYTDESEFHVSSYPFSGRSYDGGGSVTLAEKYPWSLLISVSNCA